MIGTFLLKYREWDSHQKLKNKFFSPHFHLPQIHFPSISPQKISGLQETTTKHGKIKYSKTKQKTSREAGQDHPVMKKAHQLKHQKLAMSLTFFFLSLKMKKCLQWEWLQFSDNCPSSPIFYQYFQRECRKNILDCLLDKLNMHSFHSLLKTNTAGKNWKRMAKREKKCV